MPGVSASRRNFALQNRIRASFLNEMEPFMRLATGASFSRYARIYKSSIGGIVRSPDTRPNENEYASSFAGYVALVPEQEILSVLAHQTDALRKVVAGIPVE